jgi:hypothetical protein
MICPELTCQGRVILPSQVGAGIWLEGVCGKPITVPTNDRCQRCAFSGLLGLVTEVMPGWTRIYGSTSVKEGELSEWDMGIAKLAHDRAVSGLVSDTSFKTPSMSNVDMGAKKKPVKVLPLKDNNADLVKSNIVAFTAHFIESSMEKKEVSEVIYKKVQKVAVGNIVCYKDGDILYECGPTGEIKGVIEERSF